MRFDALDQFASLRMAGYDGIGMPRTFFFRVFGQVEPQPGLAHLRVGPVATEATARENWLNVLVEVQAPSRNAGFIVVATGRCNQHSPHDQQ